MGLDGSNFFGIHEQALNVHIRRATMMANNLANEATPGYLAKDLDFRAVLSQVNPMKSSLMQTNQGHLPIQDSVRAPEKYRIPAQASLDGNTVDDQLEHAAYAENAMRYFSNVTFMGHHVQRLNLALSGGNR